MPKKTKCLVQRCTVEEIEVELTAAELAKAKEDLTKVFDMAGSLPLSAWTVVEVDYLFSESR
jgi:hypothetical protein